MIAMLIQQDLMIQSFGIIPEWLRMLFVRLESRAHNAEDLRVFFMDRLADLIELFDIILAMVFIADTDARESKWCRMPHVRAELCPLGCGRIAIGKFDQV